MKSKNDKKEDNEQKDISRKHFFITQQLKYLPEDYDVQEILKSYKCIKKWAYIIHDKDETEPHIHIYVNFGSSSQSLNKVAKWFGVEPQYVEKVKGQMSDVLKYLTHDTDDSKTKYQYKNEEVIANFNWEQVVEASRIVGNWDEYSYAEQFKYVYSIKDVSKQIAESNKLEKLWKNRCKWLILQTERNIQVVFITGKSGAGKSVYAERMLKALGFDYCISSSSNDPFQDYMGQDAIILDDLRDKAFELEDLLKILDNNTCSSIKSRFTNKVFNGKMIVITSSVPIHYWYRDLKMNRSNLKVDSLDQLYRRINNYIIVSKDVIMLYNGLDDNGNPINYVKSFSNDYIRDIKSKEKEIIDLAPVYENISKSVDEQKVVKENGK